MKTMYLTSVMLLLGLAACSGGHTTAEPNDESRAQLKKAAAEAAAKGEAPASDVCGENDWYGDGQCDTFCNDADSTDCATSDSGEVVCALFIEESNGYCSRRADDPCIGQDPDCTGDDPITCPAIAEEPDSVCSRPASDPCRSIDPDCAGSTPPSGGDDPIVCPAIAYEADGVCSRPASDPCRYLDPDCAPTDSGNSGSEPGNPGQGGGSGAGMPTEPVACTLLIEEADGVCKREPTDPCIFQDPDCNVN
ncbi:MAG TPA: hypothetical protein VEX18_20120 [Polyangiaceae bacterium]|nr:hypothetical protein [Polyangiaceae bacterium]